MTIKDDGSPSRTSTESEHPPLTAISNEAAALHREHFGRGPGAVRSHLSEDLLVCILSEAFTTLERTLIEAGSADQVLANRLKIEGAVAATCRSRMEAVVGRPVSAYLSSVDIDKDMVVDIYLLGEVGSEHRPTGSGTGFH